MPPPTPKKAKSTSARTADPEPMTGLDLDPKSLSPPPEQVRRSKPSSPGTPYSPAKEVDLGEELSEAQKKESEEVGSRQEEFNKSMKKAAMGKGRRSRKHKKSKKSRKTRKVKKHGKRRA